MKVEAIAEAIIFLCVDTNTFMLKNCCYYELSFMLDYYISKCFIVLRMKRKYIMLAILIQGPRQPGDDIDVYFEPLVGYLELLWDEGVVLHRG